MMTEFDPEIRRCISSSSDSCGGWVSVFSSGLFFPFRKNGVEGEEGEEDNDGVLKTRSGSRYWNRTSLFAMSGRRSTDELTDYN